MINYFIENAFSETIETFFIANKKKYWSDIEFINRMNDMEIVMSDDNWFTHLIRGFTLSRVFPLANNSRSFFVSEVKSWVLPSIYSCTKVDFDKSNLIDRKYKAGEFNLALQISAYSKICTLTDPLNYWIYDSQVRKGLSKFKKNNNPYYNNYKLLEIHIDDLWRMIRVGLISYVNQNISDSFDKRLILPQKFKGKEYEIIARRFLDKILMIRNSTNEPNVDIFPISIDQLKNYFS